jgi:hypothetical protein
MMTVAEVWGWIGLVCAGTLLLAVSGIAYLALLRWLIVVVPTTIIVGFAFEPDLQVKFTVALLGVLAILYLPLLVVVWVLRQMTSPLLARRAKVKPPSALETAHQAFADEEVRAGVERYANAARKARDEVDRDARARELERQGMVSLWSRQ